MKNKTKLLLILLIISNLLYSNSSDDLEKATKYKDQQKYELAEEYYLKAIEKGNNKSLANLASIYEKQEKYELAEKYYLLAYENTEDVFNLFLLSWMYEKIKNYDLSEKYYLMLKDKSDRYIDNLASIYEKQEKYELAEKYYLMSIDRDYKKSMVNLGMMYLEERKYILAEKILFDYIEKDGEFYNDEIDRLEKEVNKTYKIFEKYYLKKSKKVDESGYYNIGDNEYSLAQIYDKIGKEDLAEKYYLIANEKGNRYARFSLIEFYKKQKKYELSKKYSEFSPLIIILEPIN